MTWIDALTTVAERWRDPDHASREEAVEAVLAQDNRFTSESIAFSLNHFAETVATGALSVWIGDVEAGDATMAVLSTGKTPTEGMLEAVSATLAGHRVALSLAGTSEHLARAFFDEIVEEIVDAPLRVVREAEALEAADAVVTIASEMELGRIIGLASEADIPEENIFASVANGGIAVLDGHESRADLSGLAEDALLHEGGTPQSVRVVFAPSELDPDGLLEMLAGFRELFPAHTTTDGSLAMRAAFLEAQKSPHAVGPGFLLSKGLPEWLEQAHVRWSPYDTLDEVVQWLSENLDSVGFVAASGRMAAALAGVDLQNDIPVLSPGDAHRPTPGQPPLTEHLKQFLLRV